MGLVVDHHAAGVRFREAAVEQHDRAAALRKAADLASRSVGRGDDDAQPILNSQLSTLNFLIVPNPLKALQKLAEAGWISANIEGKALYI